MSVLAPAVPVTAEDRVSVASNWRLVWWRFRKHRLALVSALCAGLTIRSSGSHLPKEV